MVTTINGVLYLLCHQSEKYVPCIRNSSGDNAQNGSENGVEWKTGSQRTGRIYICEPLVPTLAQPPRRFPPCHTIPPVAPLNRQK
jgi:hypothetical protein